MRRGVFSKEPSEMHHTSELPYLVLEMFLHLQVAGSGTAAVSVFTALQQSLNL